MSAHQTILDTLELKKDKSTNYASKPNLFNTVSLHSIKLSGYRMGKKLIKIKLLTIMHPNLEMLSLFMI